MLMGMTLSIPNDVVDAPAGAKNLGAYTPDLHVNFNAPAAALESAHTQTRLKESHGLFAGGRQRLVASAPGYHWPFGAD